MKTIGKKVIKLFDGKCFYKITILKNEFDQSKDLINNCD